jgi:putative tricarboxylic transport membrane protein
VSDRIFAAAWLLLLAFFAWVAWKIEVPFSYEPIGPKAYPLLLAGLMAGCCVWLAIKPDAHAEWPRERRLLAKVFIAFGVLFAWAFAFEPLGFVVSTAIASIAFGRLFDARWAPNVVAGVVMGVGLYFFFDKLLDVPLPLGPLKF